MAQGASRSRAHVDAAAYVAQTPHAARWRDAQALLNQAFDDVCADTFCEGDYGNLTPLSWRCSVAQGTGALGACVWVFAGSAEFVDAETGAIQVESAVVPCTIPVHGPVERFLDGLFSESTGVSPGALLYTPLVGVDGTLYSHLSRCL